MDKVTSMHLSLLRVVGHAHAGRGAVHHGIRAALIASAREPGACRAPHHAGRAHAALRKLRPLLHLHLLLLLLHHNLLLLLLHHVLLLLLLLLLRAPAHLRLLRVAAAKAALHARPRKPCLLLGPPGKTLRVHESAVPAALGPRRAAGSRSPHNPPLHALLRLRPAATHPARKPALLLLLKAGARGPAEPALPGPRAVEYLLRAAWHLLAPAEAWTRAVATSHLGPSLLLLLRARRPRGAAADAAHGARKAAALLLRRPHRLLLRRLTEPLVRGTGGAGRRHQGRRVRRRLHGGRASGRRSRCVLNNAAGVLAAVSAAAVGLRSAGHRDARDECSVSLRAQGGLEDCLPPL